MPPHPNQSQEARPSARDRAIVLTLNIALPLCFIVPIVIGYATGFGDRLAITRERAKEKTIAQCTELALNVIRETDNFADDVLLEIEGYPGPRLGRKGSGKGAMFYPVILEGLGRYKQGTAWHDITYECRLGGIRPKFTWKIVGSAA